MTPIRVMLVDDNPTFLRIVVRFLQEQLDIAVVGTASDGKEAIIKAQALQPQVVLLDLGLPGQNGLATIPALRASLPDSSIIILTLLDTNGYRSAAQEAGADGFISKADLNVDLLPAIREIVDQ